MNTFLNGALLSRLKKKFGFVFFLGQFVPGLMVVRVSNCVSQEWWKLEGPSRSKGNALLQCFF